MTYFYKIGDQFIESTGDKAKDFELLTTVYGYDPVKLSDKFQMPGAYSDEEKQLVEKYGEKGSEKRSLENLKLKLRADPSYNALESIEDPIGNPLNPSPAILKAATPFLRNTMNGLTFNNYPRILAGMNTLFNDKTYDENKLNADAMMQIGQEDHPYASGAGALVGFFGGPQAFIRDKMIAAMGLNQAIPASTSFLNSVAKGVTTGGKFGTAEIPNAILNTLGSQGVNKGSALNALKNAILSPIVGGVTGGVLNSIGYPIAGLAKKASAAKIPQRIFGAYTNQPLKNTISNPGELSAIERQMDFRLPDGGTISGGKYKIRETADKAKQIAQDAKKQILNNNNVMINIDDVEKALPPSDVIHGDLPAYDKQISKHLDDLRNQFPNMATPSALDAERSKFGMKFFKGKTNQPLVDTVPEAAGKNMTRAMKDAVINSFPAAEQGVVKDSYAQTSAMEKLSNALAKDAEKVGSPQFGGVGQFIVNAMGPIAPSVSHGMRTGGKAIEAIYNSKNLGAASDLIKKLYPIVQQFGYRDSQVEQ